MEKLNFNILIASIVKPFKQKNPKVFAIIVTIIMAAQFGISQAESRGLIENEWVIVAGILLTTASAALIGTNTYEFIGDRKKGYHYKFELLDYFHKNSKTEHEAIKKYCEAEEIVFDDTVNKTLSRYLYDKKLKPKSDPT